MTITHGYKVPGPFLVVLAMFSLAGCASFGKPDEAVGFSSVSGGKLGLVPQSGSPILVVQSKKGIGHARLHIRNALPEGMLVEFPGLKQLEFFSMKKNGKALICHGTAEPELPCTWGAEWPVASMKRYPTGMTVIIPAAVVAEPGEWLLEWVDYYRN